MAGTNPSGAWRWRVGGARIERSPDLAAMAGLAEAGFAGGGRVGTWTTFSAASAQHGDARLALLRDVLPAFCIRSAPPGLPAVPTRARVGGMGGVPPSTVCGGARARVAGAPSKPTRRSPPGGKGARGEFRNGKRSASLKGVGRCEERTLPSPTNVPAPRGSGARGPSGGVARKPVGRRRAAPWGKGSPR